MGDPEAELIDTAWSAVAAGAPPRGPLTVRGSAPALASPLDVTGLGTACVAVALLAAAALEAVRTGDLPPVELDRGHVAAALRSERFFRGPGGEGAGGFASLSRFWAAQDGWVRTHGNYPWHAAALRRALEVPVDADPEAVGAAVAALPRDTVEAAVVAAGGVAAAVRTAGEWRAHRQGAAVGGEPLVARTVLPGGAPRDRPRPRGGPAGGIRVLDLTRVIAGPIGSRLLGALGADVLRLDPPGRDDGVPGAPADTLLGKRSATLDLADRPALDALLGRADVLVLGYRPGSLERFGLGDAELAARFPGLVIVRLAAWGHTGPWAQRRGFDSVVQAATGIADACMDPALDPPGPGALPCQLLDHGTGYLIAAAALAALAEQAQDGGTHVRRLSLARTAAWLLDAPPATTGTGGADDPAGWQAEVAVDGTAAADSADRVRSVLPPGRFAGAALRWPGAGRYRAEPAHWR